MKKFSEQFYKKSTAVKLQVSEKRELRERLVSYMEYHPLPNELQVVKSVSKKVPTSKLFTDKFTTISLPGVTLFKSSAVVAGALLIMVPFLAEKTVPGDTLYAVKVQFNEELRSTLTFDGYQKVEWETERINRRIAEARLMASEGLLTDEAEAGVAEAVRVHTKNAKQEIAQLRVEDVDEATIASIALDTTLVVQAASLRKDEGVTDKVGREANSVRLIASVINESLEQVEDKGELPAYEKMIARIEQNTTRVYELRDTLSKSVSEEGLIDVTRRVEDIERSILKAIALRETDDATARLYLVDVLQRTQKLIFYMTELLEMKETIDIDTLMPVVMTDLEEEAKILSLTDNLQELIDKIADYALVETNKDVLEKVEFAQDNIAIISAKMELVADDFGTFEALVKDAIEIAKDTTALLERQFEETDQFETADQDGLKEEELIPDENLTLEEPGDRGLLINEEGSLDLEKVMTGETVKTVVEESEGGLLVAEEVELDHVVDNL